MDKLIRQLLIASILISQSSVILAQGDCSNDPPPEILPCMTNVICGFQNMDDYCLRMREKQIEYPFPAYAGCFAHNPNWLAFKAGTSQVILEFDVNNCTMDKGIQFVIYEGNPVCNGTVISGLVVANIIYPPRPSGGYGCGNYPPTNFIPPFHELIFNTVPGITYYIVIDGWQGDLCRVEFNVLQGFDPPENIDSAVFDELSLPEFSGSDSICLDAEQITFCGEDLPEGATQLFLQLPNGDTLRSQVGEECIEVEYRFESEGPVELCLAASNGCDTTSFQCREFTVAEPDPVFKTDTVYVGDIYLWEGMEINTEQPGSFHFEEMAPTGMTQGCQWLSVLDLEIIELPEGCNADPSPALLPCDAEVICGLQHFDEYCLRMTHKNMKYYFPGNSGCIAHHPNWFAFRAGVSQASLELDVHSCQGDMGVQFIVYEGDPSCNGSDISGLEILPLVKPDLPVDSAYCLQKYPATNHNPPFHELIFNTIPGKVYYIAIDGFNDELCWVDINVLQGAAPPNEIDSIVLDELMLPEFYGPDTICPGAEEVTFCVEEFPDGAGHVILQLPNGDTLHSQRGEKCIEVDTLFQSETFVEVCMAAANVCDTTAFDCRDFVLAEPSPIIVTDTVELGDAYVWEGTEINTDTAGSYYFEKEIATGMTAGCHRKSILDLVVLLQYENSRPLADLGDSWLYCLLTDSNTPQASVDIYNEVMDTFSESEFAYSRIAGDFFDHSTRGIYEDTITIASKGNEVYLQAEDSLYLLYDFGPKPGDTMTIGFPKSLDPEYFLNNTMVKDYFKLRIDSAKFVEIDGEDLKRVYFTRIDYPDSINYVPTDLGRFYTEKLGFENFLLPYIVTGDDDINRNCDIVEFNSNLFAYENDSAQCPTGTREWQQEQSEIALYPNPSSSVLHIETELQVESVSIVDLHGRIIHRSDARKELDISNLSSGMYQISFLTKQGEIRSEKFIVQ